MTLVVRAAQLEALRADLDRRFIERLEDHVRTVFAARLAEAGRSGLQDSLVEFVERARGCGLRGERSITLYVDLCFGLGPDFEQQPEHRAVASVLRDPALGETAKMFLAYRRLARPGGDGGPDRSASDG